MILVTGAAGFIGSHLCEKLISQGHSVVGIDNFDPYYDRAIKENNLLTLKHNASFSFEEMDICDVTAVNALFSEKPIDTIIHLAALAGVRPSLTNPGRYFEVNVQGTIHLLDAAKEKGINNIVLASSSSVYGNNEKIPFAESDSVDTPISPYAASKKSMELAAHVYHKLYGMKIACLRFFTVYGPRQRPDLAIAKFCRLINDGDSIQMYGDGSTYRDYTYIEDILDGVTKSVKWVADQKRPAFEIFNLGENNTVKLSYLIETIEKVLGKKAQILKMPEQPGDVKRTYADLEKSKSVLGYNPLTAIEEGIKKYVSWLYD